MTSDRQRNSKAGGCFFVFTLMAGFVYGLSIGEPLKGTLVGFLAGAAIALAVWLVDRRRA